VRFEQRLRDGVHSGAIVLAFRRWKRSQVVAGRRYRTGIDMVEVESVDMVEPSSVDAAQARAAGYASVAELLADLRGDPALPVYRIRLRRIDGQDPRAELARAASLTEADVAAITSRLARMDRSSRRGPWTGAVLALIADQPGIVSTVLAEAMGWQRQDFKLHVRRLKELGLTLSLDVGYQLSPRGESYLKYQRTRAPACHSIC
jgi:integrase